MKVSEVWRKIEEHRGLVKKINDIDTKIRSLNNIGYHKEEFIDLSTGEAVIDLETEMKREFAVKKIKALKKEKTKLEVKRKDLVIEFEKIYKDLKRKYERDLIKLDLYFRRFLKQLRDLRMTWNLMVEDGSKVANISRALWELRSILGIREVPKQMPPFNKWSDQMRKIFNILENFEESEKHGNR